MLSTRRVKQESVHASLAVGLKRDPNRKLRDKKVALRFWAKAQFRKSPICWQLDGQEVAVPSDVKHSNALCLVLTRVGVEDGGTEFDLSVLRDSGRF
jgi:hypothetical protein